MKKTGLKGAAPGGDSWVWLTSYSRIPVSHILQIVRSCIAYHHFTNRRWERRRLIWETMPKSNQNHRPESVQIVASLGRQRGYERFILEDVYHTPGALASGNGTEACCKRCGNMFRFYSILHHHHFPSQHHTSQSIDRSVVSSAFGVKSDTAPLPILYAGRGGEWWFYRMQYTTSSFGQSGPVVGSLFPDCDAILRCENDTMTHYCILLLPASGQRDGMLSDVCELPR